MAGFEPSPPFQSGSRFSPAGRKPFESFIRCHVEASSTYIAEAYFESVDTVFLAYGMNFPDGLCGGPVAYAIGAPLVLTAAKSETAAADYVAKNSVANGYILGGTAALSDETVAKIFQ